MLMYEIANDAVNYIDYLINTLNLQISLCNIYQSFSAYLHLLHPYNAHENSYCKCIKTNRNALSYCVAYQDKTMAKCQEGEFYGRCWAGVEEFVFPITANNKALGFISVSGYRDEHIDREQLGAIAQKYNLNPDILQAKFGALSTEKPNAAQIRTLVNPLCHMLSLLYLQSSQPSANSDSDRIYQEIVNYLFDHYNQDISLTQIAEHCGYSESHVRHLFKQYSNSTIHAYLTLLRIKRAKNLLANTKMSVIDIAYEVGYNDSNYFTTTFKKETGLTPKAYRKENEKQFVYSRLNWM